MRLCWRRRASDVAVPWIHGHGTQPAAGCPARDSTAFSAPPAEVDDAGNAEHDEDEGVEGDDAENGWHKFGKGIEGLGGGVA